MEPQSHVAPPSPAHASWPYVRSLLLGLLVGAAIGVPLSGTQAFAALWTHGVHQLPFHTAHQPPLASTSTADTPTQQQGTSSSTGGHSSSNNNNGKGGLSLGAPGRVYASLLNQLGAYHTSFGFVARTIDASVLSPSSLLASASREPPKEPPTQDFPAVLRKCVKLLGEYDRLSSEAQWRRLTNPLGPHLSSLTRVAAALQQTCGVSLSGIQRGSLDRARHRHLAASCGAAASATVVTRHACLSRKGISRAYPESISGPYIDAVEASPEAPLWSSPWPGGASASGPSPTNDQRSAGPRAGGGRRRERQLAASWPVWRRGTGTQTGVAMEAKGRGSSLEPAFLESEPQTPRDAYEGVSRMDQYATGCHVAPQVAENGASLSVMIQYYRQKEESVPQVVNSYGQCRDHRPGRKGRILPRGDREGWLEVLANVDRPGEAGAWMKLWREFWDEKFADGGGYKDREKGKKGGAQGAGRGEGGGEEEGRPETSFLYVQFQHNLHENRGYDSLARVARGNVVMMTQGDDVAPQDCLWMHHVLRQFEEHDNVGTVGYNTAVRMMRHAPYKYMFPFERDWLDIDPASRSLASVVHLVDIGPMSSLRCLWDQIGGFDAAWGPLGQAGIISDWHYSEHTWMGGFRVKHVYPGNLVKGGTEAGGQTHNHGTRSEAMRFLNHGPNEDTLWNTEIIRFSGPVPDEVERSYLTVHPPDFIFGINAEFQSVERN